MRSESGRKGGHWVGWELEWDAAADRDLCVDGVGDGLYGEGGAAEGDGDPGEIKITPLMAGHLQLDDKERPTNLLELFRLSQMRAMLFGLQSAQNNIDAYSLGIEKCKLIISEIDKDLK